MQNSVRGAIALLAIAGALACSPTESGLQAEALVATTQAQGQALRMTNTSSRTAYYFAIDAELAPLANWAACTDPAQCAAVPARASIELPFSGIAGYTPATRDVILYWWHLTQRADGSHRVSEIRSVGVTL